MTPLTPPAAVTAAPRAVAGAVSAPVYPLQLLWTLVRTDFKSRYHGSLSGFVWALLKPLAMFVVLMAVFSFIFARQPDYRLNLIVGLFLWDFFNEGTRVGLIALHQKSYLLTKARFPSWIVVVSSTANALLTLLIFTFIALLYLGINGRAPSLERGGLFLLYIACFLLMVIGFSLAGSVLFLRYRDLNQIWDVLLQAGFFLAPVVYPLDILPERFHFYLYLWPPTAIIQFARQVLVAGTVPTLRAHLFLGLTTAVMLAVGVAIFRRYGPRAAEYL